MSYEINFDPIITGVIISFTVGGIFYFLSKKASNKQTLEEIATVAEIIEKKLDSKIEENKEFVEIEKTRSQKTDAKYRKKAGECINILKNGKWVWRSDVILIRKSDMTPNEFENFVNSEPGVVRSKIKDGYGNNLYSWKERLENSKKQSN